MRYHRMERSEGNFRRTVALPEGVEASNIDCTFKDGVLTVRIPKPAGERESDEHVVEIKQASGGGERQQVGSEKQASAEKQ